MLEQTVYSDMQYISGCIYFHTMLKKKIKKSKIHHYRPFLKNFFQAFIATVSRNTLTRPPLYQGPRKTAQIFGKFQENLSIFSEFQKGTHSQTFCLMAEIYNLH